MCCFLCVTVLQNTNSQFSVLLRFYRPVSFRSTAEVVKPCEDSGRVIHALQSHHNHLISTQLLNIISQCFLLLSASTCLVVCKEICILSQQGKPQTNLQRRKSCGIRHENHKDFFSFSLILPLSLLLPALCQLIKSTE